MKEDNNQQNVITNETIKAKEQEIKEIKEQFKINQKQGKQAIKDFISIYEQGLSKLVLGSVVQSFNEFQGNKEINFRLDDAKIPGLNDINVQLKIIKETMGREKYTAIEKEFESLEQLSEEMLGLVKKHSDEMVKDICVKNPDLKKINSLRNELFAKENLDPKCLTLVMDGGKMYWKPNEEYIQKTFQDHNPNSVLQIMEIKAGQLNSGMDFKKAAENFNKVMLESTTKMGEEPKIKNLWEKIVQFCKELIAKIRISSPELVEASAMNRGKQISQEVRGKFTKKTLDNKQKIHSKEISQ
jgi:hypothetical protein